MRWKCDQLRTTSLKTRKQNVHECNGDKSVHDYTRGRRLEDVAPSIGIDRETERQRDRETERQRDRETERQRDRETERQREKQKQRRINERSNQHTNQHQHNTNTQHTFTRHTNTTPTHTDTHTHTSTQHNTTQHTLHTERAWQGRTGAAAPFLALPLHSSRFLSPVPSSSRTAFSFLKRRRGGGGRASPTHHTVPAATVFQLTTSVRVRTKADRDNLAQGRRRSATQNWRPCRVVVLESRLHKYENDQVRTPN